MKRAASKKRSLNIPDFFGVFNTYRIFALKSQLPAYSFANQLGKAQQSTFTILPEFEYNSDRYAATFSVFYAEYSLQESIHCLLLENKAAISNQQKLFVSKAEEKLHFQTLSLFDEFLYLFNKQGFRCFDFEIEDIDYLLLLFARKDIESDIFSQFLAKIEPFHVQNISYILEKEQTSGEVKIVSFLRDFYCKYEVYANQQSRKRKLDLLAPVRQIPKENLQFPIPIRLENDSVADHLQLSDECLALLTEDI